MKHLARSFGTVAATAAVVAAGTLPAQADGHAPGTTSLAVVLAADGDTFDGRWGDYDVVTEAVNAVLDAKPGSPVAVLADGSVPLTAFIPDDRAFRELVHDITGTTPQSDEAAFAAVAGLGIDTVETVLLYHVVPGATIDSAAAAQSDGAELTTAQGGVVTVRVNSASNIRLVDADLGDRNPKLEADKLDINAGNQQIAHGITLVLRPVDLP
jgi:uncharacterized surface protein with fasciclin (FAS1) repeats